MDQLRQLTSHKYVTNHRHLVLLQVVLSCLVNRIGQEGRKDGMATTAALWVPVHVALPTSRI